MPILVQKKVVKFVKHSDLPDYDVTSFVKIAYEVTVST